MARAAAHDGNYAGVSGALWLATAADQRPEPPPSLLGDIAGGALYLAIGILAGVLRARHDGRGQVVDAAMVDGSAHLLNLLLSIIERRGGAYEMGKPASDPKYFARSYRCADGEWINIAAIEPPFHAALIKRLGLDRDEHFVNGINDPKVWPALTDKLAAVFASKTRTEWCKMLEGTDACFAPVLSPLDAAAHPHNVARGIYSTIDGILQAVPAPRFSATPSAGLTRVPARGAHTRDVLSELKFTAEQVEQLTKSGALGSAASQ